MISNVAQSHTKVPQDARYNSEIPNFFRVFYINVHALIGMLFYSVGDVIKGMGNLDLKPCPWANKDIELYKKS